MTIHARFYVLVLNFLPWLRSVWALKRKGFKIIISSCIPSMVYQSLIPSMCRLWPLLIFPHLTFSTQSRHPSEPRYFRSEPVDEVTQDEFIRRYYEKMANEQSKFSGQEASEMDPTDSPPVDPPRRWLKPEGCAVKRCQSTSTEISTYRPTTPVRRNKVIHISRPHRCLCNVG